MEVLNWFLFFTTMISISFFSWSQLFGGFILTIMFLGGYFNLNNYQNSNNWFLFGIANFINIFLYIFNYFNIFWKYFITKIYIGYLINLYLTYLENNYQLIKSRIRKEILKSFMGGMSNKLNLKPIPRFSCDDEDTETDEE